MQKHSESIYCANNSTSEKDRQVSVSLPPLFIIIIELYIMKMQLTIKLSYTLSEFIVNQKQLKHFDHVHDCS